MAAGSSADPTLLQTKLRIPGRRRGTVIRPRLAVSCHGSDQPRLTLLSAPPGFGKTTLLADWFAESTGDGPRVAWLSLDARDNDPITFWIYVIAALQTVAPTVGEPALAILQSAGTGTDASVATLVSDLDSLDQDVVLVLDDYHVIETAEIHEGVGLLLEHLPRRIGLVLSTRVDPPLPLARLRARGELVERRAADLRFTQEEAAQYLHDAMGLELTPHDVGTLEARTEGWIAALQLAALSLQGRRDVTGFINGFAGDDRFVVDYLIEEVLDRQPADIRQFLLETAVLNRLTGPLCDAVTRGSNGRTILERLDRANLFLVPLDDRRRWYRYHHLFADMLRTRLLAEQEPVVSELHRRAAVWWAEHDDHVEAITHALAGGNVEQAAELIELAAPTLQRARQETLLRNWLEVLPGETFSVRPVLSMILIGARMATGDVTGVDALLTGVEGWLDSSGDTPDGEYPIVADFEQFERLPTQTAVQRAGLALASGDIVGATAHAERVLSLAPPSDHVRRGSAAALMGLASWTMGDIDIARVRYAQAVDHLTRGSYFADALGCALGLADVCIALGRLDEAARVFQGGLDIARDHPGLRGAADMHAGLSELFVERNDLGRAREHLDASEALGERAGLPQHPYRSRAAAARLLQAEGDLVGALALLDEAERRYATDYFPSVRPISALKARVWLAQGDLARALRWADQRGLAAADELSYVSEFEHVTLARTLVDLESRDGVDRGAVGLLERLLTAAEVGERIGVVIECLVLIGLELNLRGDRGAATLAIERALDLAEPEGFVRVFVDAGEPLALLLRSAALDGAAAKRSRQILGGFPGQESVRSGHGLVDPLSSRELDVLRLLRSELSGPLIARELFVSLNTMRTHTQSIYTKLGVSNRREAVRRADHLGL